MLDMMSSINFYYPKLFHQCKIYLKFTSIRGQIKPQNNKKLDKKIKFEL
jgi:hypothetical protein